MSISDQIEALQASLRELSYSRDMVTDAYACTWVALQCANSALITAQVQAEAVEARQRLTAEDMQQAAEAEVRA